MGTCVCLPVLIIYCFCLSRSLFLSPSTPPLSRSPQPVEAGDLPHVLAWGEKLLVTSAANAVFPPHMFQLLLVPTRLNSFSISSVHMWVLMSHQRLREPAVTVFICDTNTWTLSDLEEIDTNGDGAGHNDREQTQTSHWTFSPNSGFSDGQCFLPAQTCSMSRRRGINNWITGNLW